MIRSKALDDIILIATAMKEVGLKDTFSVVEEARK